MIMLTDEKFNVEKLQQNEYIHHPLGNIVGKKVKSKTDRTQYKF
jgi:hypothetical protein